MNFVLRCRTNRGRPIGLGEFTPRLRATINVENLNLPHPRARIRSRSSAGANGGPASRPIESFLGSSKSETNALQ